MQIIIQVNNLKYLSKCSSSVKHSLFKTMISIVDALVVRLDVVKHSKKDPHFPNKTKTPHLLWSWATISHGEESPHIWEQ